MEKIHGVLIRHAGQWDQKIQDALEFDTSVMNKPEEGADGGSPKAGGLRSPSSNADSTERRLSTLKDDLSLYDEEALLQKLSMLQLRLTEATKTVQAERDEKSTLHRSMERLQTELQEARDKCEDLKQAKQEAIRELLALQDEHRDTVLQIQADLQDETSSRENVDRRMADLRAEVGYLNGFIKKKIFKSLQLERLQAENASEWGKRERLETEKLALERENKKLRSDLRDLQERLERRGQPQQSTDTDIRALQHELSEKNKEILDLKHSHCKVKKVGMI